MGLFNILDSIGRDVERVIQRDVEFATLHEQTQRSIIEDIRNLGREGLDENAIRDFVKKKYNVDLTPDLIKRIKEDFSVPGRDVKGLLKKIGIGAGIAGGLGLGYLLSRRGGGGTGSPSSLDQASSLSGGSPSSLQGGGELPSSPSPQPSSSLPGGGATSRGFLGLPWWVWLFIVIIVMGIIGYLVYRHYKKRKSGSGGTQ